MLEIGLLGFAQPWLLAGLLALPALWWLLRLTPPPPRRVRFPAISLLLGLAAKEESAARMPWWLLALRMMIAALVILALAEPILAPQKMLKGEGGPIVVVVDNGWAAGPAWDERQATLGNLLDEAARSDRAVTVLPTARQAEALPEASFRPAEAWRAEIGAMGPRPWPVDRQAALDALQGVEGPAEAFWLADGLSGEGDEAFASRLQRLGRLTVMQPDARPLVLEEPEAMATGFGLQARRTSDQGPKTVTVEAVAEDGRVIAVQDVSFANGQTVAHTEWTLPNDLANQVRRLRVAQTAGAGSVVLLDDRWQQRSVGLAGAGADQAGHPLLDPSHYIDSALAEIARLRTGTLEELLEADPSLIITRQRLAPDLAIAVGLDEWLENGGVLVRFASPELAAEPDDWLPVRLRPSSRVLGGAMSWDSPQRVASFPEASPFAGLPVPEDVSVRRQVLAEPAPDLREKTWASLTDGTPLVTAQSRGEGRIVLVHVTANAAWSDLPLSGVFVDMLARLVRIGQGKGADLPADAVLPPRQVLDGFGRLQEPPPGIASLTSDMEPEALGPENPPGYYGSPETGVRAWNLANAVQSLTPLTRLPGGVTERSYGTERSRDFGGWLWVAAFFLLLADFAASLILRGHARLPSPTGAAALLFVFLGSAGTAEANTEQEALRATMETHLAYVETGNPDIDRTSADGLKGLSWVLTDRTSVEPGEPIGVNIETSELAFYPLLYWPVTPEQSLPSANARDRVARYMEQGGTVLFDTRDQQRSGPAGVGFGTTPERQHLRQILEGIRVPPLIPVPSDHVLTKAFYLLQEFPGRYAGGTLWLEANADAARDGVSSVMIGGHDWAAAWAVGVNGMPRFPVIPGGDRQREFAYRFGVNLVMHVLTGNYKGDQVHVPSILERLGQ